ncbi:MULTISPECIES: hypothetical protein [unclassified Carboxylicivirga]|uniref:hypothetical protein n=1 Tax=Carboxylicivirga TaxID=1628153 RepID=UPI003D350697
MVSGKAIYWHYSIPQAKARGRGHITNNGIYAVDIQETLQDNETFISSILSILEQQTNKGLRVNAI